MARGEASAPVAVWVRRSDRARADDDARLRRLQWQREETSCVRAPKHSPRASTSAARIVQLVSSGVTYADDSNVEAYLVAEEEG